MAKKISKRRKIFAALVQKDKTYPLKDAIHILKTTPVVKFDQSVEVDLKLDVDPKQTDQMVRGTIALPHGTGKKIRVACFCKEDQHESAKKAGADIVGGSDLVEKVKKGQIDFDVAISTPGMMREMATLGKILGPKGLMPNPKAGTVTEDIVKAVTEVKRGKVEFKQDKQAGLHVVVGKRSFSDAALLENLKILCDAIAHAHPANLKGAFIRSAAISSTMSPGILLDPDEFVAESA